MTETLFIAGGTGFIGAQFLREALAENYRILALSRSAQAAETLQQQGIEPVTGDLLTPGKWQDAARTADYVIHLAQPPTFGVARVTTARAKAYERDRVQMDHNLLEPLDPDRIKRIVYVSGTSYYGQQGMELRDETTTPNPRGWGPFVVKAMNQLDEYQKHLPIVSAFPGAVYGPTSWFGEVLGRLARGERLPSITGRQKFNSPIHYQDCARALLHLMKHGKAGERYLLVDSAPATLGDLVVKAAEAMRIKLRIYYVPKLFVGLLLGKVIADSLDYENMFSNAKLCATGFTFQYPTHQEGVPNVVATWQATHAQK